MELKGIITPIITPMHEDESVNYEELCNQIDRLIKHGVQGLFFCGTNGEGYILSEEEKVKVLEVAVDAVGHRIPVYAGTGCVSTKDTIHLSRKAKEVGADVLSIITPYFAAINQDELYTHYEAVAKAVDLPIVLYNIPARTGTNIDPVTIGRLSHIENIIGAKDSSGNFTNMLAYIDQTKWRKDFCILSGNDSLILWCLLAGGKGGIAGCSNVYPENMVGIYENFVRGDMDAARKCQDAIGAFRGVFKYGNPNTVVKMAVKLLGYPVGNCRTPFNSLSAEAVEALKKVIIEHKEMR